MLLDPRFFGLNDLLRRPFYQPHWGNEALALEIAVEGEPLFPVEGHWRPSHTSLYAQSPLAALQLVQDSFVAPDGTQVVSLLLRNPSEETLRVELKPTWTSRTEDPPGIRWHRCTPPLDDLILHLPGGALLQRSFTRGCADDEDRAFKNATRWFFEPTPAQKQTESLRRWEAENAFLFDCDDPWLTRLVAHCQALRWHGTPPTTTSEPEPGSVRASFQAGDFDAPQTPCPAWDTLVRNRLVGLRHDGNQLQLTPDNFLGLQWFCLQGIAGTTVVWDDPAVPGDAYDDGDKGLTVYLGRVRVYNQPTLAPCQVPLTR